MLWAMCGRFSETVDPATLADVLALTEFTCTFTPRAMVAPTQSAPVVVAGNQGNALRELRWGLIPHWAAEETIGAKLFNACRETADQKSAFREAWRKRRCLVPATGFYEWDRRSGTALPYHFGRENGGLFCFAGLWERWERPPARQGELFADAFEAPAPVVETFTILTQPPSEPVAAYHDRMPVMVEPAAGIAWLERGELKEPEFVARLKVEPVERG